MDKGVWDDAIVPERKLTEYLLAPDHPVGGSKALLLHGAGFRSSDPGALAVALVDLAREGTIVGRTASDHGMKWIIDGRLRTPSGRRPTWRTVWMIGLGTAVPRFITAYPRRSHTSRS